MMELAARDKEFALQVAGQGLKKLRPLVPGSSILKSESPLWGKFLLLHHSALGVPTNWHTCLVSSKLFSRAVAREKASNITTAISTGIRNSLSLQDFFWHLAISQAWGGCATVSSSHPFRFTVFLIVFCLSSSFCFSYLLLVLSLFLLYKNP
jgi:hypothetical protein